MSESFTERDKLPETKSYKETVKFVGSEGIDNLGRDVIRLLDDMKMKIFHHLAQCIKGPITP